MRPHSDGTWRYPEQHRPQGVSRLAAFDERGRELPDAALAGRIRIGDHPSGEGQGRGRNMSPLAGGVWHTPGEYAPGGVPVPRNDYGHRMSQLMPEESKSRRHRSGAGTFVRAELRAERFAQSHRVDRAASSPGDIYTTMASADVQGGFLVSPLNPVGRRRTAGVKRKRQQSVTWVQRLNDRMEGR
jgi:hypothetical protein